MRVLAIETSSGRGSLALVEDGRRVAVREHETPNAHGEQLPVMLLEAAAEAGWARTSIDRVAVGVGPGSFTGLRVGIAFAQGVATGLDRPLVGVGSLRAMAGGASYATCKAVAAVLDARRGEVFLAAYAEDGAELIRPCAAAPAAARTLLAGLRAPVEVVGRGAILLDAPGGTQVGPTVDLPHAAEVARIAETRETEPGREVVPVYVRPADAIRPNLPPSPLSSA